MPSCPKCLHVACVKDGIVKGKQRYKCKSCNYRHTVRHKGGTKSQKRAALELYLEGLGFRSIGRYLRFSHVTVYNWIKQFGESLEELKSESEIEIVEIDEMHSFVNSKKTAAGFGFLLIGMGKSSSTALLVPGVQQQGKRFGMK